MSDDDKDSKTELPTEKKIQDAVEKGNTPFSREITIFASTLAISDEDFRKGLAESLGIEDGDDDDDTAISSAIPPLPYARPWKTSVIPAAWPCAGPNRPNWPCAWPP